MTMRRVVTNSKCLMFGGFDIIKQEHSPISMGIVPVLRHFRIFIERIDPSIDIVTAKLMI